MLAQTVAGVPAWLVPYLPLLGTVVGGAISAVVTFVTIRATLKNQLKLEEQKATFQRELEQEKRDHAASAFRRVI